MATLHFRKTGTDEIVPVDGDKVAEFESEAKGEWESISKETYKALLDQKQNCQQAQVKGEYGTNIDV